jgi:hypothetical protein
MIANTVVLEFEAKLESLSLRQGCNEVMPFECLEASMLSRCCAAIEKSGTRKEAVKEAGIGCLL